VVDLDLSGNPLLLPNVDARHSMFTRMAADASLHSRTMTSLRASRLQLVELPPVVPRLKCLATLDISHNRLRVCTRQTVYFTSRRILTIFIV